MKKVPVCSERELKEGFPRSIRWMTREIVVFRLGDRVMAREGSCKHMGASLTRSGKWNGRRVTCGWHGWQYDMLTGECIGKPEVCLKRYPTEISEETIYVVVDDYPMT